jgi:predicted O-methyltransferase YrrM
MVNGFFTWPTFYKDMINRFPSGSVFVEVGVLEGQSLIYLIEQATKAGKAMRITGVDHFEDQSDNLYPVFEANLLPYCDKFELIYGKSVEAAEMFEDKSIDLVFIDAAHDYESVKADIEAWLPKVRGVIAGHDYIPTYPGVMRAVDERFGSDVIKDYEFEGCWMVNIDNIKFIR